VHRVIETSVQSIHDRVVASFRHQSSVLFCASIDWRRQVFEVQVRPDWESQADVCIARHLRFALAQLLLKHHRGCRCSERQLSRVDRVPPRHPAEPLRRLPRLLSATRLVRGRRALPLSGRSAGVASCAKTDERIEMSSRTWTRVDPRNHVLHEARIPRT